MDWLKKRVSVGLGIALDDEEKDNQQQQQSDQLASTASPHQPVSPDDEKQSAIPYINSSAWYSSPTYKQLIANKKSSIWVKNQISSYLDGNYNKYDDSNLAQLIRSQPDQHKYSHVVQEALRIFDEWRKWKNSISNTGKSTEWKRASSEKYKLDQYDDTHLHCYWNSIADSQISVTKGEMIVPYPCPVVCGVIENSEHECKYEEYSQGIHELEYLSPNCSVLYAQTKSGGFMMSKRDIFGVGFNYVLPNAEVIMGCRSMPDKQMTREYAQKIKRLNVNGDEYVRAFYTLDLYHLRPWYEHNCNYTQVTYYSHLELQGSVPSWIINGLVTDTPKIIVNLKQYMDKHVKLLSKPGQIHIPLDMLQFIGVFVDEKLYRVKGLKAQKHVQKRKEVDAAKEKANKYEQEERRRDVEEEEEEEDLEEKEVVRGVDDFDDHSEHRSSDLGADDDDDDDDDGNVAHVHVGDDEHEIVRNVMHKRMRSGVDDIDEMDFAFDDDRLSEAELNSKVYYHEDGFVDVNTKKTATDSAKEQEESENANENEDESDSVVLAENVNGNHNDKHVEEQVLGVTDSQKPDNEVENVAEENTNDEQQQIYLITE